MTYKLRLKSNGTITKPLQLRVVENRANGDASESY